MVTCTPTRERPGLRVHHERRRAGGRARGASLAGIGRGLLGHSCYVAVLNPTMPPRERLAVIGGLIALDLMRAEDSDSFNQ